MIRHLLALLLLTTPAIAQTRAPPPLTPPVLDQLHRADGTRILPDRFLRRWDPITILFTSDTGPQSGGPEDTPDRLVTLTPPHPGAWTWLGPRTLQFRPTEPWQPLTPVEIHQNQATTTLLPLLPTPTATGPADSDTGQPDLDTIALTFTEPVDPQALQRALTLELRPTPGLTAANAQPLSPADYDLRPVERPSRQDRQTYLIVLKRPVPDGQIALIRLHLSDQPGLDDPTFEFRLHSAAPFNLSDTYCGEGYSHATTDGATRCTPDSTTASPRTLTLQLTANPTPLDIVQAREALRIAPPVTDLAVTTEDRELRITAKFASDTPYQLTVAPGALQDTRHRPLATPIDLHFNFAPGQPTLTWDAPQGLVERFGPQMIPLRGHGYDRADIRIHPIDPLARDFWPFPRQPLFTNDNAPPPLPGNEPQAWRKPTPIDADAMAARIQALGTPAISTLIDLPIRRGGLDAKFGLNLAPQLAQIAGEAQPGTYLVGLRTTDATTRRWVRLQVTDLVLTTTEEPDRVRFTVTALSTARPIEGAEIRLQGLRDETFTTLAQGLTAPDGSWTMPAPLALSRDRTRAQLRRFVVTKGTDTLVLEPFRGPPVYAGDRFQPTTDPWLAWTTTDPTDRREPLRTLCHVFTERPIYRPEEPILIAGMIRRYRNGALTFGEGPGEVVITAPNDQEWRLPVTLDEVGGFHARFAEKTEPTGDYRIRYEPKGTDPCGQITVKKEAYRLPTFEVLLNTPPKTTLDTPFNVQLLARFFAGGLLSDRPITWRVTQFPYIWTPPNREGFLFSSDSRYSNDTAFRSTPVLNRESKTDPGGSAQLTLDPTLEPTAQPRQYLVEATVTGDDDMQVRATQRITALPPFVLGVKAPRYLPQPGAIDPEITALDAEGNERPGLPMTVRLIRRNWNSTLQASDFAQGAAKYKTEILDETIEERKITSAAAPIPLHFAVRDAGVYLIEVEAEDQAGRRQTVKLDLFLSGDTPVTWSRPPAETMTLTTDKPEYIPGETATLIVQSPFQTARALAVIEEPEARFRYEWFDITNGYGRLPVPIRKPQAPRLAVHILLMRGRLPNTGTGSGLGAAPFDQGKPVTLAGTKRLTITPVENRLNVTFEAPEQARPAQEFDMILHLTDPNGRPLPGEATVWMVDQAVLALAKEQPLDPLPPFLVDRPIRLAARDTRAMAFGVLPLNENPGGDEAGDFGMENISVRKNFTPVPLYLPRVKFGPDGTAIVHVKLPDTLTVFMLRAKAISGPDRFGYGTGQLRVRQPIVAQPALPRFVRPGDTFTAQLIGRIVEGSPGPGRTALSTENLTLQSPPEQTFTWQDQRPARIDYPLTVPDPPAGTTNARLRFLLQRLSDRASDAVQIDLPIRPDRPIQHRRDLLAIGPTGTLDLPTRPDPIRPNSYQRTVTLAADPTITRLLTGLNLLLASPYNGTEQRIALASAETALLPFTPLIEAAGLRDRIAADIANALQTIRQSTDEDGLVAFWPKTRGTVWLTASAYRLVIAADRAGQPTDKGLADRLATVLAAALRSDYPRLLTGEQYRERVAALLALADAGKSSPQYAAELASRALAMPTETVADVALALSRLPSPDRRLIGTVMDALWTRVNLLSRDNKPTYAGLTDTGGDPLILPSETRTLAETLTATATATPTDPRQGILRTALLNLATPQGWGTTNATAAALRALATAWDPPQTPTPVTITLPDSTQTQTLDRTHPLVQLRTIKPGPLHIKAPPGITALIATTSIPTAPGATATATQNGLILTRTLYRVPPTGPLTRLDPEPDGALHLTVGDIVEEVDELATPEDRAHVALRTPLPAGLEPLNPNLATAIAEATPSAAPTLPPAYAAFNDDEILQVWLTFPKGTVTLRHRLRATIPGTYTQPPAIAETLYLPGTEATTAGQKVTIAR